MPRSPSVSVSMGESIYKISLGDDIWEGKGLEVVSMGLDPIKTSALEIKEGLGEVTTGHLLRLLAFTTSKDSHKYLSGSSYTLPNSFPPTIQSIILKAVESDMEVLAGLSSWLSLSAISHHSLAFIPVR
jgi:hypothetical protein